MDPDVTFDHREQANMARKARRKMISRKITLTDTGKELVATIPGPDGGVLVVSDNADLKSIRALIKKRQQMGKKIAQILAHSGLASSESVLVVEE
jgi:hypothetical protein